MDRCCADLRTAAETGNTLPKGLWQSHHRLVAALDTLNDRVCPFRIEPLSYYHEMQPVDEVSALAVLTLCTSALLESIDTLPRKNTHVSEDHMLEILHGCIQLERELHVRMVSYYAGINFLPFWYVDSSSFTFGDGAKFARLYEKRTPSLISPPQWSI